MNKNTELATLIIELVGGKNNISNVFHCMTRLRLSLKDEGLANVGEIKNTKGVLGTNIADGEIQVIIGPGVSKIYEEVVKITGHEKTEQIAVNLDNSKGFSIRDILNSIVSAFSAAMNPLVPIFVLVGMFNVIAVLIGPNFLKLVTTDSDLYNNFYFVGQGILYFLPFFLAVTASRHFKANTYISLVLATILLYPDMNVLLNGETGYKVFGIIASSALYTSSVIPIMLIVWLQSYVEKFIYKLIPDVLKVILAPLLIVVIMMPLSLCLLGPLGTIIGNFLANLIIGLHSIVGPIETMIVTAFSPFLVAFGIGRPIFFICMSMLFANGVEYAYMPTAMVIANFIAMGVALGFALKTKKYENRQLGFTSFAACFLGGVSEPTWFGILLPNKEIYIPTMIGGALAGLYLGIMNVGYYQFGPSNFLSVIGFISPEGNNFLHGCIAAGIAFFATIIMVIFFYKEKDN
jgi:PTS system beta-glucosides-specific IIC component